MPAPERAIFSFPHRQAAVLRALARLAPGLASRLALRAFARPGRLRDPVDPSPPGLPGERLAVDHDGRRLAVWRWGHGPLTWLVHGWGGHAGHMSSFVAPLVAAGRQVVAFDQPAHGRSEGRSTNMLDFRNALLAVGKALGKPTVVVAHSLGATATLLALDRGLDPDRLVLFAPPLDPAGFSINFGRGIGLPEASIDDMTRRLRAFVRADLGDETPLSIARRQSRLRPRPALFIHDRDDRACPFSLGEEVAAAFSGAAFHPTAGLGHRRTLGDPEALQLAVSFALAT